MVIGVRPIRLVNQAESGTSSTLLALTASPPGSTAKARERGRKRVLSAASQANEDTYSFGVQEMWLGSFSVGAGWQGTVTERRSVSFQSGSRSGKRRGCEAQAEAPRASARTVAKRAARSEVGCSTCVMVYQFKSRSSRRRGAGLR